MILLTRYIPQFHRLPCSLPQPHYHTTTRLPRGLGPADNLPGARVARAGRHCDRCGVANAHTAVAGGYLPSYASILPWCVGLFGLRLSHPAPPFSAKRPPPPPPPALTGLRYAGARDTTDLYYPFPVVCLPFHRANAATRTAVEHFRVFAPTQPADVRIPSLHCSSPYPGSPYTFRCAITCARRCERC